MIDHTTPEELSAYLDGEALNAASVESHLHECDTCQQQLDSLQSLRTSLQELTQPEVHPAFASRVRATIESQETMPARSGLRRWVLSASGLAAAALLTVAVLSEDTTSPVAPTMATNASYAGLDKIESILQQDELEIAARLESTLAREWVDGAIVSAAYQVGEPKRGDNDSDILAAALVEAEPQALIENLWLEKADSRTEIHRLTDQQSDLFKQMLVTHAREALLGDAAFEG